MDNPPSQSPASLPLLRHLYEIYPPKDLLQISSSIIDFRTGQLYGPWFRLAENYQADRNQVLNGLFDINVRSAFESWPTDKPIEKIAVMVQAIEREDHYVPGVTPLLVRLCDATGSILASMQEKVFKKYPDTIVPNTVLVLKRVPIFHRARFSKSLLIALPCIAEIYPELEEDRTITLDSQYTQVQELSSELYHTTTEQVEKSQTSDSVGSVSTPSEEKEPEGDEPIQQSNTFLPPSLTQKPLDHQQLILQHTSSLNCLDEEDEDNDDSN